MDLAFCCSSVTAFRDLVFTDMQGHAVLWHKELFSLSVLKPVFSPQPPFHLLCVHIMRKAWLTFFCPSCPQLEIAASHSSQIRSASHNLSLQSGVLLGRRKTVPRSSFMTHSHTETLFRLDEHIFSDICAFIYCVFVYNMYEGNPQWWHFRTISWALCKS